MAVEALLSDSSVPLVGHAVGLHPHLGGCTRSGVQTLMALGVYGAGRTQSQIGVLKV